MNLIECYQKNSYWYQNNPMGKRVIGVLWHDTAGGNPYISRYVQPFETDKNYNEMIKIIGKNKYGNDWNHNGHKSGLNAWIGKLADGSIATVQAGEWTRHPSGCGSGPNGSCNGYSKWADGNFYYDDELFLNFEICDDGYKDKNYFEAVYKEACEFTAYICDLFNIDPMGYVNYAGQKVPTILCHQDSYKLGLGNDHGDVYGWFTKFGKNMDSVRKDVQKILKGEATDEMIQGLNVGDLVKIIGTKYYNGVNIPSRILNKNWYVYSISGDRVIINESEDHKDAIMSPVKINDVEIVSSVTDIEIDTVANNKDVISVGGLVKIIGTKYYNGVNIPSRILDKNWYVYSISGDRVIINESEDHKDAIMSPVNIEDLQLVVKKEEVNTSSSKETKEETNKFDNRVEPVISNVPISGTIQDNKQDNKIEESKNDEVTNDKNTKVDSQEIEENALQGENEVKEDERREEETVSTSDLTDIDDADNVYIHDEKEAQNFLIKFLNIIIDFIVNLFGKNKKE